VSLGGAPRLGGFGEQALTPADLDGITPPPSGSPAFFATWTTRYINNPTRDYLKIWTLDGPSVVPAASLSTRREMYSSPIH
jgi:hypothetical protein